ncbi:uncharacterized protein SOCE26_095930 [Sorangium cellulosum]|uniref:Uncharacterized protein n=1 Tax=Sorangium cellulosum TaxID=56 RepID=A0A2L0F905_SORCE|nr:uncharacterized protein SOCE26_095930 [Sorangium cellulosum]
MLRHLESHVEQRPRDRIDLDAPAALLRFIRARALLEQGGRPLQHLAGLDAPRVLAPARHQRHAPRPFRQGRADPQRAAGRERGHVGRAAGARHRRHHRPVEELLHPRAQRNRQAPHLRQRAQRRRLERHGVLQRTRTLLGRLGRHDRDQPPLVPGDQRDAHVRRGRAGVHHLPEPGQALRHRRAVGWPRRGLLGQHPPDQLVQRNRHLGPQPSHARRLLQQQLGQERHRVLPMESRQPRQALEQHAPQREHVGARVDQLPLPPRLLWRHVPGRAERGARLCQPRRRHRQPREPEVEHLHVLDRAVHEEQVARLDIAVNDPARVRRPERLGHRVYQGDRLFEAQRSPRQPLSERLAREPLHDQVRLSGGRRPVGDIPDDVGVLEPGERPRLVDEARRCLRVGLAQQLEGHGRAAGPVEGPVDRPHPSATGEPVHLEAAVDHAAREHHGAACLAARCSRKGLARPAVRRSRAGGCPVREAPSVVLRRVIRFPEAV